MTERILKSSISVLDAFNDVRNNQSLADDNPVLNRNESLLIFNHVTSAIRFVWALEQSIADKMGEEDIPLMSAVSENSSRHVPCRFLALAWV